MCKKNYGIIFLICLGFQLSYSQPADSTGDHGKFSLSIYPLGVLSASFGGNVEYLLMPKHSFEVGGAFYPGVKFVEFFGESEGYLVRMSYRYHWDPGFNSPFTSFFIRHLNQESKSEVNDNGEKKDLLSKATILHAGVGIGRKWVLNNGFTICLSIGYGIGYTDVTLEAPELDEDVLDITESFTKVFIGLDGEISIGWSF